jgi:hypothetical protein
MNNDVAALLLLIALGLEKDHAIGMAQHAATNVVAEIFIFFSRTFRATELLWIGWAISKLRRGANTG